MSARIILKVPQASLDIYEAAAIAALMGTPRLAGSNYFFCLNIWHAEDQHEVDRSVECLSSDLTDIFGPLIADALAERVDVRHEQFGREFEQARLAMAENEERYRRELAGAL